jgi:hypothetical protein|eukprot:SAG25_NODE_32_length_20323_cov_59.467721_17_plen_124_part_00
MITCYVSANEIYISHHTPLLACPLPAVLARGAALFEDGLVAHGVGVVLQAVEPRLEQPQQRLLKRLALERRRPRRAQTLTVSPHQREDVRDQARAHLCMRKPRPAIQPRQQCRASAAPSWCGV